MMGFAGCAARLDTSRRRRNSPISVRGSSLSAITCCGRRETVGLLASRVVEKLGDGYDGLRLKNGLGGG